MSQGHLQLLHLVLLATLFLFTFVSDRDTAVLKGLSGMLVLLLQGARMAFESAH